MPLSENEEFYYMNRDKIPSDFANSLEYYFELKEIFYQTEPLFAKTIQTPLIDLMKQQYPDFQSIIHPVSKQHVKDINNLMSFPLIWSMFHLLQDQKKKVNLAEKYPQLENWRAFYCIPPEPSFVKDSERDSWGNYTDEEWEQFKIEEDKRTIQFHTWEQSRKQAFYDILQPLLFNTLPALHDLEGDSWVIYAMIIGDRYDEWKTFCEHLETVINYELPPESFYWTNPDFQKAMHEKGPEYLKRSSQKRNKMIDEFAV